MIEKQEVESYEILSAKDFVAGTELGIKIIGSPEQIKTKYRDNQVVIPVELPNSERRTWFANWTSVNMLIDDMGKDETQWVDEKITVVLHDQYVSNGWKKIIYLKGAFKAPN